MRCLTFKVLVAHLLLSSMAWAGCVEHSVTLQVLGSGGPELNDKRASSSYLVWADNKAVALIDAGGGSALNYEHSNSKFDELDVVLFSHFHVDHSADFPAFVKGAYFSSRNRPLPIYGPEGNKLMPSTAEFMQNLFGPNGSFKYLHSYLEPNGSEHYWLDSNTVKMNQDEIQSFQINPSLNVSAISVHHGPIPALAWRVNIDGCSITFSGDMNNDFHSLEKLAMNTDILVAHNAIPEQATGVARSLHMPPSEIGLIAERAEVKKLVISHRMMRTLGIESLTEQHIRKSYSASMVFANDLDLIVP